MINAVRLTQSSVCQAKTQNQDNTNINLETKNINFKGDDLGKTLSDFFYYFGMVVCIAAPILAAEAILQIYFQETNRFISDSLHKMPETIINVFAHSKK